MSKKRKNNKSIDSYALFLANCRTKPLIKLKNIKKLSYGNERMNKLEFLDFIKEHYGFEGFHHYTDFNNFVCILKAGYLYSRKKAEEFGFIDAADQNVLRRTRGAIKTYVRFYYKEKTPTLYKNEGILPNEPEYQMPLPVLLLFDEKIILRKSTYISSGGCGNPNTEYSRYAKKFSRFDWPVIFSRCAIPRYGNGIVSVFGDENGSSISNKRNAEFLYPSAIM